MLNQRRLLVPVLPLALSLCAAPLLPALAAKKPAAAPAKKPAAAPAKRPAMLGTQQFKGDQAVLGQPYTLGKENPINVTVSAVEYTAERIAIGEARYVPKADEKLLVISFAYKNPLPREQLVRFDTVHFTAIDAKETNYEAPQTVGVPGQTPFTGDNLEISLKPGQPASAFTYVVVPANAVIARMLVKSRDDLVLRYDLRGKIKPLKAPYADSKDATGATALAEVPTALNTPFQIGNGDGYTFDLVVENVAFVDGKLGETEPEEGKRLLVMTAKVTNQNADKALCRFDTFHPEAITTDDEKIAAPQEMLHPTANRSIEHELGKGASGRFRMFFQFPKDSKPKSLVVRQSDGGRAYLIDISGVK